MNSMKFYQGKRVLLTGHTGFKGSWMSRILYLAGAEVIGYSLDSKKEISLFELTDVKSKIVHIAGDVRDFDHLLSVFNTYKPEIVIHMAAQPLVRESYTNPVYTYETNVLGTVNLLECVRLTGSVKSLLNVTTDKVYMNREWVWGYRENEPLDGYDPYSNSKSCSELVTHSYVNSFFKGADISVSTARAGNVIGGGDFAKDRIIPDCIRSIVDGRIMGVRNPHSIRPYQHVLEPLFAYLMIVERQYENKEFAGWYNVGPDDCDCVTTGNLVELFKEKWGEGFEWENQSDSNAPHEANFLKLDCSSLKSRFGWTPTWHIDQAVEKIVDWTNVWLSRGDIPAEMDKQIEEFGKAS